MAASKVIFCSLSSPAAPGAFFQAGWKILSLHGGVGLPQCRLPHWNKKKQNKTWRHQEAQKYNALTPRMSAAEKNDETAVVC